MYFLQQLSIGQDDILEKVILLSAGNYEKVEFSTSIKMQNIHSVQMRERQVDYITGYPVI